MTRATIKRLGRPVVAALAAYSGYCRLTNALRAGQSGRIVSYHGINDDQPANVYAVTSQDFAQHMAFLAQHCTVLSLERLVDCLRGGEPLPPHAIAITFDDGYLDAYTQAFPILQRWDLPATMFLPVDLIAPSGADVTPSWHDASARRRLVVGQEGRLAQAEFLSWQQVCEMSRHGIDFGSHTLSHVSLTRVSRQWARVELARSKARLEDELGKPVTGLAYPYGTVRDFSPAVEQLVAEAGYVWAVTGLSGVNTYRSNRYALRRTKIEHGDRLGLFARATRGALDPWIVADQLGRLL
jgi:peptidoglycan/xylan/chitin deacetylase (PgdA/CDA1 family)